jgi:hypothetical protein
MITVITKDEQVVPSPDYPKGFVKNDTGERFIQPNAASNIFNLDNGGQEVPKSALVNNFTEKPYMEIIIENVSTVELVD